MSEQSQPICLNGDEIMIVRCFCIAHYFDNDNDGPSTDSEPYIEKVKCTIEQFANSEHLIAIYTNAKFKPIDAEPCEYSSFDEYSPRGKKMVDNFLWGNITTIDISPENNHSKVENNDRRY